MNAPFDFRALETPLDEQPLFFIEAKDREKASEFDRQRAFVNTLRRKHPQCMVTAIPNGSKDSDWSRLRKWQEGLVRGYPDTIITWNHGTLFAEFKNGADMPRQSQIDVMNRLHRQGFRVGVYRNAATLLEHLADAGAL